MRKNLLSSWGTGKNDIALNSIMNAIKEETGGVVGVRTGCIDGSKERRVSASASVRGMLFANSSVPSTCFESVFLQQQYAQHLLWLLYCRAAVGNTSCFDTVGSFNS